MAFKNLHASVFVLLILFLNLFRGNAFAQANNPSDADCPCRKVAAMTFPGATITASDCVTSGYFTPPGSTQPIEKLPAFCRIAATLKPTSDSNIRIELWLPLTGWNERFMGTGNGGLGGGIAYGSLAGGLKRGFATANTDMGTAGGADAMIGHPEKWADFGHRATHEMTVTAKAILKTYYGKAAKHSYFVGCSTGGQQALMEAQRYPDDYDGILAGAPANNRTHLHTGFVWNHKATNQFSGSALLPAGKTDFINNAILKACAGKDGGAPGDNFLTDPRTCRFNLETLPKCPDGTNEATCITKPQLAALKMIYTGPINPRTGEQIYTPLPFGSENSSTGIDYHQNPKQMPLAHFYQQRWLMGADFTFANFDFDEDQDRLDSLLAPVLNANNPDLEPLKKRGGKILMYSGTADAIVPFQDAVNYYERVVKAQGGLKQTQRFFRFFLIPGMGHCGGGPGLTDCGQSLSTNVPQDKDHDVLTALINWVENEKAPDKIIATAFTNGDVKKGIRFQRPLFPYPKIPTYSKGDVNLPASYKGVIYRERQVLRPAERYLK